jgi:CheY-like chemotaxis protein
MFSLLCELKQSKPELSLPQMRLIEKLEHAVKSLDPRLPTPAEMVEEAILLAWDERNYHIGVEVTYFIQKSVPDAMQIDHRDVVNMLASLLSISMRLTNTGNIIVFVEPRSEDGKEYVVFGVHDTGMGMKPEALIRLFEHPEAGDSVTAMPLEMCRAVAAALQASMEMQSEAHLGTTIRIKVPLETTQVPAPASSRPLCPLLVTPKLDPFSLPNGAYPMQSSWQPSGVQTAVLAGKRVVILDSSKFMIRALSLYCTKIGMQVVYSQVGTQEPFLWLRTEAKKGEFDVVIMDLWQFGAAVPDEVLCTWGSKNVAVVLMSPRGEWEAAQAVVLASPEGEPVAISQLSPCPVFVGHLPKPVIFSGLADLLVTVVMRTSKFHQEIAGRDRGAPTATPTEPGPASLLQDTKEEEEQVAAVEWAERIGRQGTIDERVLAQKREGEARKLDLDQPLHMVRETEVHKGPISLGAWQTRKAFQQAAGAQSLAGFQRGRERLTISGKDKPMLLVVEDNTINQRILIHMLARLGYKAVIASDGKSAIELATAFPYKLILMDVHLPEMSGIDATKMILEWYLDQKKPAPIVVSMSAAATKEECLAAGMKDFIGKPYSLNVLETTLNKWLTSASSSPTAGSTADTAQVRVPATD